LKRIPLDWRKLFSETLGERKAKLMMSLVMVSLVLVTMGFMWPQYQVEIQADDQMLTLNTSQTSVKDVLQEAQVLLGPQDEVVPDLAVPLKEGMQIRVRRAVPVTILVDEQNIEAVTAKATVRDVLNQQSIELGEKDLVEPGLATPITAKTLIKVSRVREKLTSKKVIISNWLERRLDQTMPKGQTRVIQKGSYGIKERIVQFTYVDGKLTKKELIREKIIQEPVNKIVIVGAKKLSVSTEQKVSRGVKVNRERKLLKTSRGTFRYRKTILMNASAYAPGPRCNGRWGNRTALGMRARYGVVAVDRGVIPLGTRLYVEGYGHAIAADVGGAIKGNRIDLCFNSYNQALRFGRQKMRVYVLD